MRYDFNMESTEPQQNIRKNMVEQGVWIKDAHTSRFSDYPLALSDEWDSLWWMISVQSGPLNPLWVFESEENEAFEKSAFAFALPGEAHFDFVWRPNVMRTFAPHIVLDEWSYFCGITALDEESAKRRAFNVGHRFPLG